MSPMLIKNITALAGDELTPTKGAILIEDGKISLLLEEGAQEPSDGVTIYDGKGAYAMPGLIDCHNHLSLDCSLSDYLMRMNDCESALAITATDTLRRDILSGVTTARCMGDRFFIDVLCRQFILENRLLGPSLQVSGIGMRSSRGHGYVGMPFDGVEALRGAIRENLAYQVDWIKFYATGTAPKDGEILNFYSREEKACIINTAHEAGLPVTSHCIGGMGMKECLDLGIDCLEHLYYADPADIERIVKQNVSVCLTPSEYFTDKPNAPRENQTLFKAFRPTVHKSMETVIHAQLPFALGTDGMHGSLWQEAQYAVEFGASVKQALKSLTINGASLLGLGATKGTIAPGKDADMVLLNRDPYADLLALQSVAAVIKGGVFMKNDYNFGGTL